MKKYLLALIVVGASLATIFPAQASDREVHLPIEAAMAYRGAETKLDSDIKYYFGKQKHPKVLKQLGTYSTNKKTNAFAKSDADACNWAFQGAMLELEKRAKKLGANAVINIVSYYKKDVSSSETQFECHAGGVIAGVALKGDFVKVANK